MALLHDQNYVIAHLRASYLQAFPDGIGNRIINPNTHIYYTRSDPLTRPVPSAPAPIGGSGTGFGIGAGLQPAGIDAQVNTTSTSTTLVSDGKPNETTNPSSTTQQQPHIGEPILASQSIMQLVSPSSPPIPTSTLRDMSALQRRKRAQNRGGGFSASFANRDESTRVFSGIGAFDLPQHVRKDARSSKKKSKSNSTGASSSTGKKKGKKGHSSSSTSSHHRQKLPNVSIVPVNSNTSTKDTSTDLAQAYTLSQAGLKPRASTIPPDAVAASQYPYTDSALSGTPSTATKTGGLFSLDKESNSSTDTLPLLTNIARNSEDPNTASSGATTIPTIKKKKRAQSAAAVSLSSTLSATQTQPSLTKNGIQSRFSGSAIEEASEGDDTFEATKTSETEDGGDLTDWREGSKTDTEENLVKNTPPVPSTPRKHKTSASSEISTTSTASSTAPESSSTSANTLNKYKKLMAALPPGVTLSEQQQQLIVRHHRLRKKLLRLQQQLTPSELTLYRNGELTESQLRTIYMRHKASRHHHQSPHHDGAHDTPGSSASSAPTQSNPSFIPASQEIIPSSVPATSQLSSAARHTPPMPRSSTTSNMLALGKSTVTINGTTAASGLSNPQSASGSRSGSASDSQRPKVRLLHRQTSLGMSSKPIYSTASVSTSSLSSLALGTTSAIDTQSVDLTSSPVLRPTTPPPSASKPASAPTTPSNSSPNGNSSQIQIRKMSVGTNIPTSSAVAALMARTRQTVQQQQAQLQRRASRSQTNASLPAFSLVQNAPSAPSSPKKKHKKKKQQLLLQLQLQQQHQLQLQQRLGLLPIDDNGSQSADQGDAAILNSSGIALANALGYAITPNGIAAAAAAVAATSGTGKKSDALLSKLSKQSAGSSTNLAKQSQNNTDDKKIEFGQELKSLQPPSAPPELPRGRTRNLNRTGTDDLPSLSSSNKKSPKKANPFPKKDLATPVPKYNENDTNQLEPRSKLTSQINEKRATLDDPLEVYVEASGKSEARPLKLKMYMPSSDQPRTPWEVVVRRDVNVANAIGFALYCYNNPPPGQVAHTPKLPPNMCNANKWTLRIVEDDGEPDEDFPALDRTRLISAFSFDEFALVEATSSQAIENEKATPSVRRKKNESQNSAASSSTSVSNAAKSTASNPEDSNEINTTHKAVLNIYQYPYDDMVSSLYWTAEVDMSVTVGEVLFQICIDKNLNRSQYVLKQVGRRHVLPMNSTFSNINLSESEDSDDDSEFSDGVLGEYDDEESVGNGGLLLSDVMVFSKAEGRRPSNVDTIKKKKKPRQPKESANNDKIVAHQRRQIVASNFEITPKRVITSLNGYHEGPSDLRAVAGENIMPLSTSPEYSRNDSSAVEEDSTGHATNNNRNSVYGRRSSVTSFYHRNSSENTTSSGRPSFSIANNGTLVEEGPTTSNGGTDKDTGGVASNLAHNASTTSVAPAQDLVALGLINTNTSTSAALAASARQRLRASIVPKSTSLGRLSRPSSGLGPSFTNDLHGAAGGFYRYKVWRRQPMSFIARHERVLTIDGDYIHLVPAEDPAWYDSLKTSSFHVSQMVKCKISRKVPTNFKIVVNKNNGTKRYDLEAPTKESADEIVRRLKTVFSRYLLKTSTGVPGSLGGAPQGSLNTFGGSSLGAHDLLNGASTPTANNIGGVGPGDHVGAGP